MYQEVNLPFCVERIDGLAVPIIDAGVHDSPKFIVEYFSTSEDAQTVIEIHVLRGKSDVANQNKSFARYRIANIPPAPKGEALVKVTFAFKDNRLKLLAADSKTGVALPITWKFSGPK